MRLRWRLNIVTQRDVGELQLVDREAEFAVVGHEATGCAEHLDRVTFVPEESAFAAPRGDDQRVALFERVGPTGLTEVSPPHPCRSRSACL